MIISEKGLVFLPILVCMYFQRNKSCSLVLPWALAKFKRNIATIFRKHKEKMFSKNRRLKKVLNEYSIGPIFMLNKNIKKLLVRTKL